MRRIALSLLISLGSAFALARCTTSSPGAAANEDSGIDFDSSLPTPTGNDAAPSPKRDAGSDAAVAASPDAQADAGTEASAFSCTAYDASIEFDSSADDGSVALIATEDGGPDDAGTLPEQDTLCSATGSPPGVTITFVNDAPCTLELWWVDFDCHEQLYGTLAPNGGDIVQGTYEGHVWRIREPGTERVLWQYTVPLSTTPGTVTYP